MVNDIAECGVARIQKSEVRIQNIVVSRALPAEAKLLDTGYWSLLFTFVVRVLN